MRNLLRLLQKFFLSERGQLVFAVVLLVLVPGALVFNTYLSIRSSQRVMDIELQRKAYLAEKVFQATTTNILTDANALQSVIDAVAAASSEVYAVDVMVPDGERFRVVASLTKSTVGSQISDLNAVIAFHQGEAIGYQTVSSDRVSVNQSVLPGDKNQRYWIVVNPIKDQAGLPVALVSMKFSSQIIDDQVRDGIQRATAVLVITILVVILLLASNSKLFQYTLLFRKLKEVDQMKDDFISISSHELRTPITGIRGYLEMLLDGSLGEIPVQAKSTLLLLTKSSERLNDLVEELLNVSRIEQGRLDLTLTPVEPLPVIREVMSELLPLAIEKRLKLEYRGSDVLPAINVNRDRLKQVLINLVGNGVKYTPQGEVTVLTEVQEEQLRLKVADTGIGMSPQNLGRLFTKFYRIQSDQTKEISGSGLGLWITREIVEKMNGTIEVESIEGVGSQFIVSFPLLKPKGK